MAREILTRLEAKEELILEVCDIVGHHHHPRPEESINFKSLYDADMIANLEDRQKEDPMAHEMLTNVVEKSFLTESGRNLAKDSFLKE